MIKNIPNKTDFFDLNLLAFVMCWRDEFSTNFDGSQHSKRTSTICAQFSALPMFFIVHSLKISCTQTVSISKSCFKLFIVNLCTQGDQS